MDGAQKLLQRTPRGGVASEAWGCGGGLCYCLCISHCWLFNAEFTMTTNTRVETQVWQITNVILKRNQLRMLAFHSTTSADTPPLLPETVVSTPPGVLDAGCRPAAKGFPEKVILGRGVSEATCCCSSHEAVEWFSGWNGEHDGEGPLRVAMATAWDSFTLFHVSHFIKLAKWI